MKIFFFEMREHGEPRPLIGEEWDEPLPPQLHTDVEIKLKRYQVVAVLQAKHQYPSQVGVNAWVTLKPLPIPEKPAEKPAAK